MTSRLCEEEGRSCHDAIFVIPRRGGASRQLTSYELDAHHPSWSPDGKYIAFSARLPGGADAWGIAILEVPRLENRQE